MPQNDLSTTISRIPSGIIITVVCVLLALVIGLLWAILLLRKRQKERTAVLAAQAETEKQKIRLAEIEKNAEDRNRFFANISHVKDITKITGYVRGGCSPLGMKKPFPTVISSEAKNFSRIYVSGGRIGSTVQLSPDDLASACGGKFADVTAE